MDHSVSTFSVYTSDAALDAIGEFYAVDSVTTVSKFANFSDISDSSV